MSRDALRRARYRGSLPRRPRGWIAMQVYWGWLAPTVAKIEGKVWR
jgi:hypothetical protein